MWSGAFNVVDRGQQGQSIHSKLMRLCVLTPVNHGWSSMLLLYGADTPGKSNHVKTVNKPVDLPEVFCRHQQLKAFLTSTLPCLSTMGHFSMSKYSIHGKCKIIGVFATIQSFLVVKQRIFLWCEKIKTHARNSAHNFITWWYQLIND